jgi:hypothetical protein
MPTSRASPVAQTGDQAPLILSTDRDFKRTASRAKQHSSSDGCFAGLRGAESGADLALWWLFQLAPGLDAEVGR